MSNIYLFHRPPQQTDRVPAGKASDDCKPCPAAPCRSDKQVLKEPCWSKHGGCGFGNCGIRDYTKVYNLPPKKESCEVFDFKSLSKQPRSNIITGTANKTTGS